MSNTTTKRKSDYKIAKLNNPLQQQQHFISDTDTDTNSNTDTDSSTNGNNNNNKTNKNKLSNSTPTPSRFATLQSSPSLEDSTNTISVASINVRGINNSTKFESILEDLINKPLSIIGIQETKISEIAATTRFKELTKRFSAAALYKSYWDFDNNDRAAGVGLIIAEYISKYVQRIHRHEGRFIAIDLFLPGKKLKIINIYAHQQTNYKTKGKELIKFIKNHIIAAEKEHFQIIIMGDFNADPDKYHQHLELGQEVPKLYELVEFLTEHNYIDQSPKDIQGKSYATYYASNLPKSRIDLIWYPEEMIRSTFCFDQV